MEKIKYAKINVKSLPFPLEFNFYIHRNSNNKLHFPFLYFLHGGNDNHSFLERNFTLITKLMDNGTIPQMVIVCPNAQRSQYMNYKNGKELWETALIRDVPNFFKSEYNVTFHQNDTCVFGISMGGLGALRMVFKYPQKFGIAAAIAPGIVPSLTYNLSIHKSNLFFIGRKDVESIFGSPMDKEYWKQNNPVFLAVKNHKRIIKNNVKIYVECGDCDSFHLNEGTAFLHSELNKLRLKHEYHMLHNIDHVGPFQKQRIKNGLEFIGRMLMHKKPSQEEINFKKYAEKLFKHFEL